MLQYMNQMVLKLQFGYIMEIEQGIPQEIDLFPTFECFTSIV